MGPGVPRHLHERRLPPVGGDSAAGRLSEEFRQEHPAIEAREMKALRTVLIHGYADVDLDTVWDIIHHDLPRLKHYLDQLDRDRKPEFGD
ncbi:MAG: DUF86 domain-containing protein [Thermaerobacter sp.]|nr:DUF86 domain-containing protein [Thermaerobacter sp.]